MQARLDVDENEAKRDLNNPGAEEVLAKMGGKQAGLPFLAFLDEKGELIVNSIRPKGGNIGHPAEPAEVDWFLVMLKKAAPAMSPEETKTLEDWLRTQKK